VLAKRKQARFLPKKSLRQGNDRAGRRLQNRPRQQDANVLDRGNQIILDLLSPQPTPAGAFEPVIVGGIGKTALQQILPPPAIPLGRRAVRLRPTLFQNLGVLMPAEGATGFGPGALRSQSTLGADPNGT